MRLWLGLAFGLRIVFRKMFILLNLYWIFVILVRIFVFILLLSSWLLTLQWHCEVWVRKLLLFYAILLRTYWQFDYWLFNNHLKLLLLLAERLLYLYFMNFIELFLRHLFRSLSNCLHCFNTLHLPEILLLTFIFILQISQNTFKRIISATMQMLVELRKILDRFFCWWVKIPFVKRKGDINVGSIVVVIL